MEVATIPVRMVQMTINQIVDMIAVRDSLVATFGAMRMRGIVAAARMAGRAVRRHVATDRELVFGNRTAVLVVQRTVMEIVDMTIVAHRGVAATRAVGVRMIGV